MGNLLSISVYLEPGNEIPLSGVHAAVSCPKWGRQVGGAPDGCRQRRRMCEDTRHRGTTVQPHPNCSRATADITVADLHIAEGFVNPKTQGPDSLRRSGPWHLLLPWEGGLRHALPQPESLHTRIPRVTMMWISIAGCNAGKSRIVPFQPLESRVCLAVGHGETGAHAGRCRTPTYRD